MEQLVHYMTDGTVRGKVLTFCYILFTGWFQLSKASFSWWLSIAVGVLAAANYLDQMIQRRKNKK